MTRAEFLTAYRKELVARYVWALDEAKLNRYMESVEKTISTRNNQWNANGEALEAAWKTIGGEGRSALVKLRALK